MMNKLTLAIVFGKKRTSINQEEIEISLMVDSDQGKDPLDKVSSFHDLQIALSKIGEREAKVICLRFGLGCKMHTLADIAKIISVSRERVRQIEERGIKRLQRKMALMGLLGLANYRSYSSSIDLRPMQKKKK